MAAGAWPGCESRRGPRPPTWSGHRRRWHGSRPGRARFPAGTEPAGVGGLCLGRPRAGWHGGSAGIIAAELRHARPETTRAYTRPSADRSKAVDLLPVDEYRRPLCDVQALNTALLRVSGVSWPYPSSSRSTNAEDDRRDEPQAPGPLARSRRRASAAGKPLRGRADGTLRPAMRRPASGRQPGHLPLPP